MTRIEETTKRDLYNKVMQPREDPPYHVWSLPHPFNMEEVCVTPVHHLAKQSKLEWRRLELSGEYAYLDAFAAKFKQLFSTLSIK